MKHIAKKWLAGILSVVMVFSLLPVMARAEEDGETPEKTAVERVQELIDALPDAETITGDNRADVEAQIAAIDGAMAELSEDEAAALDTARYDAAVAALSALDGQTADPDPEPSAAEKVQALIDGLPEAESITTDNRADVEAQLAAIDEAKLGLEDEELDVLDITRYMAAVEAISALDGMSGAGEPKTIANNVSYVDANGSSQTQGSAIDVTNSTTTWNNTWYVVSSNVDISDRITVSGTVNLILKDGCTLTAQQGISVNVGNSLTIYCQSGYTGTLVATNPTTPGDGGGAAIGADRAAGAGSITINGGNITATVTTAGGACIGMGGWDGAAGSVTVNNGHLKLTGNAGGEGPFGAGGTVAINGGIVEYSGSTDGTSSLNHATKQNCIVFTGNSGQMYGNPTITGDITIPSGKTLPIPSGSTLTVAEGATLTNEGSISNSGNIVISGTGKLVNKNAISNSGSIAISDTGNLQNDGTITNVKDRGTITGTERITGTPPETVDIKDYLDWDQDLKSLVKRIAPNDPIQVTNSSTTWSNDTWYVVIGNVTISDRITVKGTVHLILMDDCTLTAQKGISVNPGNSLTIYGQSGQSGSLSATAEYGHSDAGIGGDSYQGFGAITINGGIITATGGSNSEFLGSAGIGGGGKDNHFRSMQSTGGTVTINGGNVTAKGDDEGAGVGGGYECDNVTITINGGKVVATGGTGIGGGRASKNVAITINGGDVTANGDGYGSGIGSGGYANSDGTTTININGGTVTATGGSASFPYTDGGAGIGGQGSNSDGTTIININGGTVTANGGKGCAGIGRYSGDRNISFSTGQDGNAVIVASSISDKGQQNSWSGIIIEGNTGKIYGTPTPKYNFEIPSGKTLNVENSHPLHIASDVTMTNKGTINVGTENDMNAVLNNEGTIINEGMIDVWGQLTHGETGITNQNGGKIVYHFNLEVKAPTFAEAKYGYSQPSSQKITITNNGQVDANITSVTIDGSKFDLITGEAGNVAQGATNESWSVRPKAGLSIGTHTATITVTYSGNGGTSRTATAEVTFTVVKANPTVTVSASGEPTYGSDITLTAEVIASGVTESEINDNVTFKAGADVLGTVKAENGTATLTIKANDRDLQHKLFGTNGENVTVTAEYAGNSNIKGSEGTKTVTIKPKTLTFTFKATGRTYDTTTKVEGSFDVNGKLDGDTVEVSTYTASVDSPDVGNAKEVTASVTNLGGDDAKYYTPGTVDGGTVNISQAELDLTVAAVSITYGTKLTNDLLNGSTAKIKGTEKTVTGTFAWEYQNAVPTVSDSGSKNYKVKFTPTPPEKAGNFTTESLSKEITITVGKATPTVTVEDVTGTYGDNITITAKVTVQGVDESHISGKIEFTDGGIPLGDANVENGVATLTISGSQRNEQHALFGSNGSSNVTATYSGDSNIDGGSGDAAVNITPKALTYTVTATGKVYDGDAAVVVQLVPNNLVPGDSVTLTATGSLSSANANTYHQVNLSNITKDESADAKYYSVDTQTVENATIQGGVTISPKMVELVWKLDNGETFTISYDGKPHTATATVNNKVNSDEVEVTVEVKPDNGTEGSYDATATDAGNYTAKATGLTGGAQGNYTLNGSDTATKTITISKVLATCTTPPTANEDLTYTGEAQQLVTAGTTAGGTMMYALGENGSTKPGNDAFDSAIPTGTDAKTYYVWYYVQGDGNHDDSEKGCVVVSIGPAKVSFTIGAEDKVDWATRGETNEDPNPEGYVIEGTNLTMTYDSYEHKANVTQTEGEAVTIEKKDENGYSVTYKRVKDAEGKEVDEDAIEAVRNAGTYEIYVTINPVSSSDEVRNYVFSGHEGDTELKIGEITVKPYEITVAWTHLSYVYHGHTMHPNITVLNAFKNDLYTGTSLPTNFNPDTYNGNRVIAFGATEGSDVGEYTVTAKLYGTSAGNYVVDDNTETVTIVPAPVTFTVGDNVWVIGEGGALSRNTVTLRPAWGAVSTTPDVAVHHSYPLAGTKLDVDTLNVTIEYWQNGEKVEAPSEAGKYEVWVKIGNENYRHSATETGELHHVGELVITDDPDSIRTYTVTFDPGYEGAPEGPAAIKKAFPNQTVVLPPVSGENGDGTKYDITREGYSFLGWSYNGRTYQPNEELHMPAADVTFKGEWIEAVPIGGRVVQESSGGEPTPVNGATVVLKQGSEPTAEAVTGSDGSFDFGLVTPGIYNLEVTYENGGGAKIVKTFLVEVGDSGSVDNEFVLPGSALNTVVEVAPGIKSAVSMDGMITDEAATDVYTESDKKTVAEGGTVEFKMSISETTLTGPQEEEIPVPEERISMVLDMKLTKTVTSSSGTNTTEITDSKIPVTTVIHLPAEIQGKSGYTVYRFHDEDGDGNKEMRAITTSKNENGEYLQVVREGTAIELHAEFYSTYVLTWYQSSGGGATAYPVTLPENALNGTVTANYEKAVKNSVVTLTVTPDEGHVLGELTVTGSEGNAIALTDNGDGTYSFVMPDGGVTVKAVFVCEGGENCQSRKFTDLDVKAWYHDYTDYVIACGLMHGVGGSLFDPNGAVTRAQMVTVLWNMSGDPVVNYYMTYSDVSESAWYAEAIRWATSEGVVDGYGNGKFGPNDLITREQMATMLYRYEKKYGEGGFDGEWEYELGFTDADKVSDWALEAVSWCAMKGVITGKDGNRFDPKGPAKRCEMAAVLTRYRYENDTKNDTE